MFLILSTLSFRKALIPFDFIDIIVLCSSLRAFCFSILNIAMSMSQIQAKAKVFDAELIKMLSMIV